MRALSRLITLWVVARLPGGLQHHDPFAILMENVQLFKRGNMVHSRVGAGV
jgi:hypothetical protein